MGKLNRTVRDKTFISEFDSGNKISLRTQAILLLGMWLELPENSGIDIISIETYFGQDTTGQQFEGGVRVFYWQNLEEVSNANNLDRGALFDDLPSIESVLNNKATSYWLKHSIGTALERDPVDAVNDVELLLKLMTKRAADTLLSGSER